MLKHFWSGKSGKFSLETLPKPLQTQKDLLYLQVIIFPPSPLSWYPKVIPGRFIHVFLISDAKKIDLRGENGEFITLNVWYCSFGYSVHCNSCNKRTDTCLGTGFKHAISSRYRVYLTTGNVASQFGTCRLLHDTKTRSCYYRYYITGAIIFLARSNFRSETRNIFKYSVQ